MACRSPLCGHSVTHFFESNVILVDRGRLLLRCFCCRLALLPKSFGDLQRFDIQVVPPCHFVTGLMQLLMVITAEGDSELIAAVVHAVPEGIGGMPIDQYQCSERFRACLHRQISYAQSEQ